MKSLPYSHGYLGALFLTIVCAATDVAANAVYLNLAIDPATTAFSGIPAAGGFSGTSTRSGPGTWQLYALDDMNGSYGISYFQVQLSPGSGGTIANVTNRSPLTSWDDDNIFGNGLGPYQAGFDYPRGVAPIRGGQDSNAIPHIGGFGQEASNFQAKTGGLSYAGTFNGQWGNYATVSPTNTSNGERHWLFLAEGTYSGAAPTIDLTTPFDFSGIGTGTGFFYYIDAALSKSASATLIVGAPVPEPSGLILAIVSVLFATTLCVAGR